MRKLFEEKLSLLSAPGGLLSLVDPPRRYGGDAHAVPEEDDHILGNVIVVGHTDGVVEFIPTHSFPVGLCCGWRRKVMGLFLSL